MLGQREEEGLNFLLDKICLMETMKPKVLLPSLKEKKRYVAFEVISEKPVDYEKAREAIRMAMLQFVGELGVAKAGLAFLDDWKNNKGIFRVAASSVTAAKAAMATIQAINGKKVIVRSISASGILNKIRKKALEVD